MPTAMVDHWKISTGAVTLFQSAPSASGAASAIDLFKTFWRAEPERFQKQPNPLAPETAQGRRGGVMVNCAVLPGRIDLALTPPPPTGEGPGMPFPLIEASKQFQDDLLQIIEAIGMGVISTSIGRVALNLQFLSLEPDVEAASQALVATIPADYKINLSEVEDFVLQINRPYSSEVIRKKINFITRWSVERFQIIGVPVRGGVPTSTAQVAAKIAFDINNIPEHALSAREQSLLLDEALKAANKLKERIGLKLS